MGVIGWPTAGVDAVVKRDSLAVFDGWRFIGDVEVYRIRHRLSKRELLAEAGVDLSSGLRILQI